MKRLFAFAALIAVSACTMPTVSSGPPATISAAPTCGLAAGTKIDERALYAAEAAYNVPAQAYVAADARGVLSASVKGKLKPVMVKAYDALKLARAAYNAGDACGFQAQSEAVINLAAQANALLPK